MKFEKNSKYFSIAVYAFLVIAASIILFFMLQNPQKITVIFSKIAYILSPVMLGFSIAYILNPLMKLFEHRVFKKVLKNKSPKLKRVLSIVCTYIIFLGLLTAFIMLVVPSLIVSITELINNLEGYYNSGITLITEFLSRYKIEEQSLKHINDLGSEIITYLINAMKSVLPALTGIALSITEILKNIIIGFTFSIYMLFSKDLFADQAVRLITAFTKPKTKSRIIRLGKLTNETFVNYIVGHIVDSLIVGTICYIFMRIFSWPYPELIAIIIGITNMIPFFGPFIGAVPSALLILLKNPWQAFFFIIFIIILQQIDGNIIAPKIIGQRVGLSVFWVLVALVIGGSLFGIIGMFISVPVFAVFYTVFKSYLSRRLQSGKAEEAADEI